MSDNASKTRRTCFVSTSCYTYKYFLRHHIDRLARTDKIVLIGNDEHGVVESREGVTVKLTKFKRKPHLFRDSVDLLLLFIFLRRNRFDVIYTISPKGGLLGAVAGWFARVPVRIHFFTGQVWVTRSGIWRWILKSFDKRIARFCTHALVDSPTQLEFLVSEDVVSPEKARVLGIGSMAGVDSTRFRPDQSARSSVRKELQVSDEEVVVLYVGRLNRDKGVADLAAAFSQLANQGRRVKLWLVGEDEGMEAAMRAQFTESGVAEHVCFVRHTAVPEKYMQAADIFCLPSYREGFGIVAIEAAACGLPAVASDIYGLRDAIVDGQTGFLHKPKSVSAIVDCLSRLVDDRPLRESMGQRAAERAAIQFEQDKILDEFIENHVQVAGQP